MNEPTEEIPNHLKGPYISGRRAWRESLPIDRNPHNPKSEAGKAWEAGWMSCEDEEREK